MVYFTYWVLGLITQYVSKGLNEEEAFDKACYDAGEENIKAWTAITTEEAIQIMESWYP